MFDEKAWMLKHTGKEIKTIEDIKSYKNADLPDIFQKPVPSVSRDKLPTNATITQMEEYFGVKRATIQRRMRAENYNTSSKDKTYNTNTQKFGRAMEGLDARKSRIEKLMD